MDDPEANAAAGGRRVDPAARVVLVTNVGQGYGRAVALGYGRAAFDVVCADRDVDLASRTAAEVEEGGGHAIPIQADMTTQIDVANAYRKVLEIFGRLGGIVHVANQDSHTPFAALGEPEFAELIDENLRSSFLTLRAAQRLLGGGWVVIVAPPSDNEAAHMVSLRSGLAGLVAGMHPARDGAAQRPLRVNLVVPSRAPADPGHDARLVNTVLFLGSNAAAALEGQRFDVLLPPPPRVVEALLPEVRAALDASVRQSESGDENDADAADENGGDDGDAGDGGEGNDGGDADGASPDDGLWSYDDDGRAVAVPETGGAADDPDDGAERP